MIQLRGGYIPAVHHSGPIYDAPFTNTRIPCNNDINNNNNNDNDTREQRKSSRRHDCHGHTRQAECEVLLKHLMPLGFKLVYRMVGRPVYKLNTDTVDGRDVPFPM